MKQHPTPSPQPDGSARPPEPPVEQAEWYTGAPGAVLQAMGTGADGLAADEAAARLQEWGRNVLTAPPNRRLLRSLAWLGLLEGAACMAAFFASGGGDSDPTALPRARGAAAHRAAANLASRGASPRARRCLCRGGGGQVASLCVCRSEQGFAFARAGNPLLLVGLAVELALLGLVVYCPWFHPVFGAAPMVPADWLVPVLAIPAIFGLEEGRKWIVRHSRAGRRSGAVAARK